MEMMEGRGALETKLVPPDSTHPSPTPSQYTLDVRTINCGSLSYIRTCDVPSSTALHLSSLTLTPCTNFSSFPPFALSLPCSIPLFVHPHYSKGASAATAFSEELTYERAPRILTSTKTSTKTTPLPYFRAACCSNANLNHTFAMITVVAFSYAGDA